MLKRLAAPFVVAAILIAAISASAGSAPKKPQPGLAVLAKVNHLVVIYQENHSFDNLYGGWEGVNGLERPGP